MSFTKILDYYPPEFTISIGGILLVVYFVGVVVSAFRLTDRFWHTMQFLKENGGQATQLAAWQPMPTVILSNLALNWTNFEEQKKQDWLAKWSPIHPVYAWEALLVEVLLVLNWWNPLFYSYRKSWAELYQTWEQQATYFPRFSSLKTVGYWSLAASLGAIYMLLPQTSSRIQWASHHTAAVFETTVFEYKNGRPHDYYVEWGGVKLPLKKFANPNGYSAEIEVELSDFKQIIKKPFKIFKDGLSIEPGTLSIMYKSNQTGTQAYINGIDPKKVKLLDRRSNTIFNDSLGLGDEIVLFGDAQDIYLSRVEIRIKDPNAGFEPRYFVPQINHLEASMHFQIVARQGKRALVKLDPESPKAAGLLQLYSDAEKYEIVQLPGFRTNRHYLTEAETMASRVAAANFHLTFQEKDAYYLREYQSYQDKEVRLVWGVMEASPSNTNYPLDSFQLAISEEPRLLVGDDTLELVSFQVIIAEKNAPARCFETYRTGDLAVKSAFEDVQDNTSIFFEKIVVRDKSGERLLFPASFVFNVGKPSKYKRSWEPSKNFLLHKGAKPDIIETPKNLAIDSIFREMEKRALNEKKKK